MVKTLVRAPASDVIVWKKTFPSFECIFSEEHISSKIVKKLTEGYILTMNDQEFFQIFRSELAL